MNAVITEGEPVGESVLQGEGAGPGPTSSALMSDLLSILRGNIKFPFGIPNIKRKSIKVFNYDNYINSLYLRFEVMDKPGVLAQITNRLALKNISVERLIQIPKFPIQNYTLGLQGTNFRAFAHKMTKMREISTYNTRRRGVHEN